MEVSTAAARIPGPGVGRCTSVKEGTHPGQVVHLDWGWRGGSADCNKAVRPEAAPRSADTPETPRASRARDGHFRAYAAKDGHVLWDFDTFRSFETVNKVVARGGGIDGPGATVVDGMVYVNSGYAFTGGGPGNVLLAFSVDGK